MDGCPSGAYRLDLRVMPDRKPTAGAARERPRPARGGAARPCARDRRGHAHERRHRLLLRGRQARDPATRGLPRAGHARRCSGPRVGRHRRRRHDDGRRPRRLRRARRGAQAKAFFVRKETKAHGLQRRIEGPPLDARGPLLGGRGRRHDRRLHARRDRGAAGGRAHDLRGRLACSTGSPGAGPRSKRPPRAPYVALTTIDDVYPERAEK